MIDSEGLRHHIGKGLEGPKDHAVIQLMGKFKEDTGSRYQLHAIINETD